MRILSIGEVLWDVIDGVEHLGGAPLNFAAHAARLGHNVRLISAVGKDDRGQRALRKLGALGLSTRYIRTVPDQPTGTVTVWLDPTGQPSFTIHRPAAYDFPQLTEPELQELASWPPEWIYLGTLCQTSPQAKDLTRKLIELSRGAGCFYDVNLRVGCYTPSLVGELMAWARLVKLNNREVFSAAAMTGRAFGSLEEFCRGCSEQFGWEAVCVTRGPQGCALLLRGEYVEEEGYPVQVADTVGAGDAFAAAFLHGFGRGWSPREIAEFCNRVGALVASREGAIPPWTVEDCQALTR